MLNVVVDAKAAADSFHTQIVWCSFTSLYWVTCDQHVNWFSCSEFRILNNCQRLRYYFAPLCLFIVPTCPCGCCETERMTKCMHKDHTQYSVCASSYMEISSYYLFKFILRPALVIFNDLWRDFFFLSCTSEEIMHSVRKWRSKDTWWIHCWTSAVSCNSAHATFAAIELSLSCVFFFVILSI